MPFTKHIEYGPDKLPAEVASNDGTPLKAAWTGVIMYGPLAMTGTGATTWHQATLSLDPKLDQLQPTTDKGNLFTLKLGNKIFEPDYYRNHNSTHYYRLQFAGSNGKNHTQKNKSQAIAELRSLIAIATERVEEQTRWNSLTKKVPDYAPWAPHGFQRLQPSTRQSIPCVQATWLRLKTYSRLQHCYAGLAILTNPPLTRFAKLLLMERWSYVMSLTAVAQKI